MNIDKKTKEIVWMAIFFGSAIVISIILGVITDKTLEIERQKIENKQQLKNGH